MLHLHRQLDYVYVWKTLTKIVFLYLHAGVYVWMCVSVCLSVCLSVWCICIEYVCMHVRLCMAICECIHITYTRLCLERRTGLSCSNSILNGVSTILRNPSIHWLVTKNTSECQLINVNPLSHVLSTMLDNKTPLC